MPRHDFSNVLQSVASRCRQSGDVPMRRLAGALRAAMEDTAAETQPSASGTALSPLSALAASRTRDE